MAIASDMRFWCLRAVGLYRRGISSLRTRGLHATWQRLQLQFQRSQPNRDVLYLPAPTAFSAFTIASSATPRASIIIPIYGALPHTIACLRAIAAHPPQTPFEVIVVDDASPDDSLVTLQQVSGICLHPRAQNGGFIAACNDGAALAKGEFLVFLNNDTIPQPGWLDALLETFHTHSTIGLVGAKLVYPDGRLQEAGGVLFADGSAWNYGRFESPDHCRYTYLRDADYLSGAAIALPRELFAALGGFDTRYAPAYYEDADLAFAVRQHGLRTVYQPAAVVVHDEGTSGGTQLFSGPKAAQVRNQQVFFEKWQAVLSAQPAANTVPSPALLHRHQPQILLIDALTPQPDRDSASVRLVELMRLLMEEGAHVVFLPASRNALPGYTQALQRMGVECWHAPDVTHLPHWLREHGARFATVILSRHYIAHSCAPLVRQYAPQAKLVFDTVDLHYLREQRAAELAQDASAQRAALQTRKQELDLIHHADLTLVVSDVEQTLLRDDAPNAQVAVLSNLHRLAAPGSAFAQRADVLFVGGFRHPPNVDAVLWFVSDVFPLLRAQLPMLRFHCIGGDVPDPVAALAQQPGVHLHGYLPDLQPWLDGCRVSIAPLRFGAGVKGKINQAMAHGLPVVATHCAAEGMHLTHEQDVLLADTASDFAQAILRVYHDEALWQQLAEGGRRNIQAHFSPDAVRDNIRTLFFPKPSGASRGFHPR